MQKVAEFSPQANFVAITYSTSIANIVIAFMTGFPSDISRRLHALTDIQYARTI